MAASALRHRPRAPHRCAPVGLPAFLGASAFRGRCGVPAGTPRTPEPALRAWPIHSRNPRNPAVRAPVRRSSTLTLGALLALVAFGAEASATLSPGETDPRKIMDAVEAQPDGDRAKSRMKMTITDASGSTRERVVQSQSMDFPEGTKQLILFESPADVRNTGLLTVDYDDGEKVDDQWLYLPSLRKSTRISSSSRSGAFMGSDISFADMTGQSPDQYDYTLLEASKSVGGEDCWLIEARPRTKKAKDETGYVKSQVWVSKSKLLPLQAKHWIKEGKKIKLMKFDQLQQLSGIWVPQKISARTLQNGKPLSTTVLSFSDMSFDNPSVKADDFDQRRLEQGL